MDDGDFSLDSMPLTFTPGSVEGAEFCVSPTVYSDNLVEPEEVFVIILNLVSSKESFFSLGNVEAAVYIIDSNCTLLTKTYW